MAKGFTFERNLPHQVTAVNSTTRIFNGLHVRKSSKDYVNNLISLDGQLDIHNKKYLTDNILKIQEENSIDNKNSSKENIFDIQMETGTGKTYTYAKTMFELNKQYGIFKFIIVLPTLAIKSGTVNFLKSKSSREHFRSDYSKNIKTYVVDSKEKKGKKDNYPTSVSDFIRASNMGNDIHVLIINSGMALSKSLDKSYHTGLFDEYNVPIDGIKACRPVMIIDEPHKFKTANKTFKRLLEFGSQFIIRYGATFDNEYYNLLYKLSSIDAFNQDLVKGISVHIDEFKEGKKEIIQLESTDGTNAIFNIKHGDGSKKVTLIKGESLHSLHEEIDNLYIDNLNKTKVVLSNGLELKKRDKINPFSYSSTIQDRMLQKAVKNHFKLEKQYLTRGVKIKPLTLVFIDDIESYRNDGEMALYFESLLTTEMENILKTETNEFYSTYLKASLNDIKRTHGGYFSKDNSSKDEEIEKEINEILHNKEELISLKNVRRFIFSKWTLKEGWDNPNVFQIVKLRTSGSETSKLQEVGRGLRIPVNEFMERVKDEDFKLHYYVDFTEYNFVETLKSEINSSEDYVTKILSDSIITNLITHYEEFEDDVDVKYILTKKGIIDKKTNTFINNGLDTLKKEYPLIVKSIKGNKVTDSKEKVKMVSVRRENYNNLRELWELINKKVIIEYKFKDEEQVSGLLLNSIVEKLDSSNNVSSTEYRLNKNTGDFSSHLNLFDPNESINTLKYGEFLKLLSKECSININTIHLTFLKLNKEHNININDYLDMNTVRVIKKEFNDYLIKNVDVDYNINYKSISNKIHPTSLTDEEGNVLSSVVASNVGVKNDKNIVVSDKYLFDEAYFDSELELENINSQSNLEVDEIIVYTKIPKNSVKMPIVGGYSYSPDFAYVIKYQNGEKELNLVIETKGKNDNDLSIEESTKIKLASKLYSSDDYKVTFRKQMKNDKLNTIIKEIIKN